MAHFCLLEINPARGGNSELTVTHPEIVVFVIDARGGGGGGGHWGSAGVWLKSCLDSYIHARE